LQHGILHVLSITFVITSAVTTLDWLHKKDFTIQMTSSLSSSTFTSLEMSYYGVYPNVAINYMICSTCSTSAFTWMAEAFSCPNCGDSEYVHPISDDKHAADDTGGRTDSQATRATQQNGPTWPGSRKRKRSWTDEDEVS
jgi:hypothetical protein